jgi:hypothetical protein
MNRAAKGKRLTLLALASVSNDIGGTKNGPERQDVRWQVLLMIGQRK